MGLMTYLDYDPSNPPPAGDLDAPTKMQALGNAIAGTNEKIAALPFNIYSAVTGKDSKTGDALNNDAAESEDIVNRYPGNAFKTFSQIAGVILNPGIAVAAIPGLGQGIAAGTAGLLGYGAEGGLDIADAALASRIGSAVSTGVEGALQQLPSSVAESYNPQNKTFDGSQIIKDEITGFAGGVAIGSIPFRKAFEKVTGKEIPSPEEPPTDEPGAGENPPETPTAAPTAETNPNVQPTTDGSSRGPDFQSQGTPPEANPVENIISGDKNPINADDLINKDSPDPDLIHANGGQTFIKLLSTQDMTNIQNVITDAVSRNITLNPDVVGEMMAASPKFRAFVNDPSLLPTLKQVRNDLMDQESSISKRVTDKDAVSTSDPTVNSDSTPKASPESMQTLNNLIQIAERVKAGVYDANPTKNFTNYMNERALSEQPTPIAEPEVKGVKNLNIAKDGYESFQLDPEETKTEEGEQPAEKEMPETQTDPEDQKAEELFSKNNELAKEKFEEMKLRRPILKRLLDCVGGA